MPKKPPVKERKITVAYTITPSVKENIAKLAEKSGKSASALVNDTFKPGRKP